MIDYKNKYLKYKIKYLNLVEQIGGKCSHPLFGKRSALELIKSGCTDPVDLFNMFKDINEAKKLGYRFKEINNIMPLDRIVNDLLSMNTYNDKYSKPLESLKNLGYFEGVEISEWLKSLMSSNIIDKKGKNIVLAKLRKCLKDANYLNEDGRIIGFVPNIEQDKELYIKIYNDDGSIYFLVDMFGLTIKQLFQLGLKKEDLKTSGFTTINWKKYGYTVKELHDAGIPGEDIDNRFSYDELVKGGYTCRKISKPKKLDTIKCI